MDCTEERSTRSFKSFPQAVQEVNIKSVPHLEIADDDSKSVFYSKLDHWNDLNLTEGFHQLLKSVRDSCRTLPMVVFNQDKLFEILQCHAEKNDPMYLEPVYQLICALAQDIQADFLDKFYPSVVKMVAKTSYLKDAAVLKSCFESFNQIIKVMIRLAADKEPELLETTLKLFEHGVAVHAFKMCGVAISQIFRKIKGASKRQKCLQILFQQQTECNSAQLLDLSANILASSLRTTATSLIVNADQVWKQILTFVMENLTWEDSAVVQLCAEIINALKTCLCDQDFTKMCAAVLDVFLANRSLKINVRLDLCSLILKLTAKSKTNRFQEQVADVMTGEECQGGDVATFTQTLTTLLRNCRLETTQSLFKALITSKRLSLDQKCFIFTSVAAELDAHLMESNVLPALVRSLVENTAEFPQDNLVLAVETVATFVKEKKSSGYDDTFTVEFQCAHPDALTTIPNKLLLKLEQSLKTNKFEDLEKELICVATFRPLHQDMATKTVTKLLRKLTQTGSENLASLCLCLKVLGSLVCPATFFKELHDGVMKLLLESAENPSCARVLEYALCQELELYQEGSTWIDGIGGLGPLTHVFATKLNTFDPDVRKRFVHCLASLSPQNRRFESMNMAEGIEPTVQSVRDRLRYLECVSWTASSSERLDFEAGFRYLIGQLSINFAMLWDPTVNVLNSFLQDSDHVEWSWSLFTEIFTEVNSQACSQETTGPTDYPNVRNWMLKSLLKSNDFVQFVEKKHVYLVDQFLDGYVQSESKAKGFTDFINVFKKFSNLRRMKRFEELKAVVEDRCLMNPQANEKTIHLGIEFMTAAYKPLRPHKEFLEELTDSKKTKEAYLSLNPEKLDHAKDPLVLQDVLFSLIAGKLKRTSKDKRSVQLAQRKFILRTTFQLGPERGVAFLRFFRERVERHGDARAEAKKADMVFDVFLIATKNCHIQKDVFSEVVDILLKMGQRITTDAEREIKSKIRKKLLENVISTFETFTESTWSESQKSDVLKSCLVPLLQEDDGERKNYLSKIVDLFQLWAESEKYHEWFFMRDNYVLNWITDTVFQSKKIEDGFLQNIVNVSCNFVLTCDTAKDNKKFVSAVFKRLESWLKVKNQKCPPKSTLLRLKTLHVVQASVTDPQTAENLLDIVSQFATKSAKHPDVQSLCIAVLDALLARESEKYPVKCLNMFTGITNEDVRKKVGGMLWAKLQRFVASCESIHLDDNFLHGGYQALIPKKKKEMQQDVFLFVLYYAAAQIYSLDFTQRSAAVLCLRDIIRHAKKSDMDSFRSLVDDHVVNIVSRGFQSRSDRVQCEFIDIFLECLDENQAFGTITDVAKLADPSDPDLNFFENMKHIQKHRRGRAMRRLAKALQENPDFLGRKTKITLVTPLVKTYIQNADYISLSEVIHAAIECLGSLAFSHNLKDYRGMLFGYMAKLKVKDPSYEAPFKKQRVKILAAILNSFHFKFADNREVLTSLIENLLFRLAKVGNSQAQEEAVDVTLFVPVLKIMLLFPEEKWLEKRLPNLVVNVCARLRSRKIEERQHARDVLCEMAGLLGAKYFPYILSILEGSLQRGYQLHILLFTVNAVVNAVVNALVNAETPSKGVLFDSSVGKMLVWIESELFGNLLEEKRIAALVRQTQEARKTISFNLLETLGAHVSKSMIVDVVDHLVTASVAKRRSSESQATSGYEITEKLRKAVKAFQVGLSKNPTMERTDFLQVGFGILTGKLLGDRKQGSLLKELAFHALCTAAVNESGTTVMGADEVQPLVPLVRSNLEEKDVNVVIACLKFVTTATTRRPVCQELLSDDGSGRKNFMFVITQKCRQYHPMRNKEPYNAICQILRNLLTNVPSDCNMGPEQVKAICLFFQMCVESNYDDINAIKLLGLLLLNFYTEEASSSFLQLLCVASIKARDEMTFGLIKSIVGRLVKRHNVVTKCLHFFVQHISYELIDGRRRAAEMCSHLLELTSSPELGTLDLKSADFKVAKMDDIKLSPFDVKGVFTTASVQLLNEQDYHSKRRLESLIQLIVKMAWIQKKGNGNPIFEMVEEWICKTKGQKEELCFAIGTKILKFYLDVVRVSSAQLGSIVDKCQAYVSDHDSGSKLAAFCLVNTMDVLTSIVLNQTAEERVDFFNVSSFEKFARLLTYFNPTVRQGTLKFFKTCLETVLNQGHRDDAVKKVGRKRKHSETRGHWFLNPSNLQILVGEICELGKFEAREADLIVDTAALIFKLSSEDHMASKSDALSQAFLYKKLRSIFTHEKFNIINETERRFMFYRVVERLVSSPDIQLGHEVVQSIVKHMTKDRRQNFLEELCVEIEKRIQDME